MIFRVGNKEQRGEILMSLSIECGIIREILENIQAASQESSKFMEVYKCNGISIDLQCYVKSFGNDNEFINKEICEMKLKDIKGNSELIGFALDEKFIQINFLYNTEVNHLHIGDIMYEISKYLEKPVFITQLGEPKLYIAYSSIWNLNATEIAKEW